MSQDGAQRNLAEAGWSSPEAWDQALLPGGLGPVLHQGGPPFQHAPIHPPAEDSPFLL